MDSLPLMPAGFRLSLVYYKWSVSCLVMSDSMRPHKLAHQLPLSMEFPRQEYWGGLLFPAPGDLLDPGIERSSLASPALTGGFRTTGPPGNLH